MYSIDNPSRIDFCNAIKNQGLLLRRISNNKDVIQAVYDVYKSPKIFARRMRGRGYIPSKSVELILDYIGNSIYSYFNAEPNNTFNQTNYDIYFYELCDYFQIQYNILAGNDAIRIANIEFGIAQKLINMVFKYLSCYEDYITYADLFEHCHMPIDSYVLHYLNTMQIIKGITSRFTVIMTSPTAKYRSSPMGPASSWSNLSICQYKQLVNDYRIGLGRLYIDYTCLHEEYYIWEMVRSRNIGPIMFKTSDSLPCSKTMFHG